MNRRRRLLRALRTFHLYLGLCSALYFMLIAATGVALNHREGLRLEERYFGRKWLPSSYRPQDGAEVRGDIVVGDLHSGLIFGRVGAPVMDLVAAFWFLSLVSGLSIYVVGRSMRRAAPVPIPFPAPQVASREPADTEPEPTYAEVAGRE
jgi:uncharacterized iron-regulated membrane protein